VRGSSGPTLFGARRFQAKITTLPLTPGPSPEGEGSCQTVPHTFHPFIDALTVTEIGTVYLVGAGPGDPGLITLKGRHCLQHADLVLYDGLVNPLILRHTKAEAARTCRTKTVTGKRLDQEEINRRLIAAARDGKTVVRLKGGDPFIFGRGGEEAQALAAAGIPFEVVPGITAATAAGAYAGLSLTHRDTASQVVFVTGHEDPRKSDPAVDYRLLAEFPGTLVFYMGLNRLEAIVESLMQNGKPAEVSSCVISRATLPVQRIVDAPLNQIAERVRTAELHAPSLFIVGEVVSERATIDWFERLPLFGKRVGITRPEHQAEPAMTRCLELGAEPVLLPAIEIHPPETWDAVDAVLSRVAEMDWLIFTSANGVQFFLNRLWETGRDARHLGDVKIACIGPSTAETLQSYHLRADVVPDTYRAEALAGTLLEEHPLSGKRVLWPRASRGRDVLPEMLTAAGANFEQVIVYRHVDVDRLPEETRRLIERGELDWIGLSSPAIARSVQSLLPEAASSMIGATIKLASISPVTTAAANEAGLPISAEAEQHTWDGIFEAIVRESAPPCCPRMTNPDC